MVGERRCVGGREAEAREGLQGRAAIADQEQDERRQEVDARTRDRGMRVRESHHLADDAAEDPCLRHELPLAEDTQRGRRREQFATQHAEHPRGGAGADERPRDQVDDRVQFSRRVRCARGRCGHGFDRDQAVVRLDQRRRVEPVHPAEVVIYGRRIRAGPAANLFPRRAVDPALREDLPSGFEQRLARAACPLPRHGEKILLACRPDNGQIQI